MTGLDSKIRQRSMAGLEEAWVGLLDWIVVIFVVSPVRDFIFLILSFFCWVVFVLFLF